MACVAHNGGTQSAVGGPAAPQVFTGYKVPELTVETLIDATGVLPSPMGMILTADGQEKGPPSVQPYIELIKKVMYSWQSEDHGPAFLKVYWGKVFPTNSSNGSSPDGIYRCQLEDLSIKYSLFSATGNPVRAELTFKFKGVEDMEKAAEGYSPDLTHYVEIKYGDNLPKLCKDEPAICVAVKLQEELQAGEQRANCVADIKNQQPTKHLCD
jgi:hypothetical protein